MQARSQTRQEKLTIVSRQESFEDYPFTLLSPELCRSIELAYKALPKALNTTKNLQLKHWECVLQIAGINLPCSTFGSSEFWSSCVAYVGAINSRRFIDATQAWRHRHTTAFALLLRQLGREGWLVPPLRFESHIDSISETLEPFIRTFEGIELVEEKVWVWRGWWSNNRDGRKPQRFPLYAIYARLGRDFTQRFYDACNTWATSHNAAHNPTVRPLAEFIGNYEGELTPQCLLDPHFVGDFWMGFFEYFIRTRHDAGNNIITSLTQWNNTSTRFITGALEGSGLFAKPALGMPAAPKVNKPGRRTNVRVAADGVESKMSLITHVPLTVSDDQAMEILFHDIKEEIDLIEKWANAAANEFNENLDRREEIAKQGQVRIVQKKGANTSGHKALVASGNPLALANAAATFLHFGYETHYETRIGLKYPKPLPETAYRLGIPISGALLPYLTLLVREHPKITCSFLEKLQLYDAHGRLKCVQVLDGVTYLVGQKDRAGGGNQEQKIPLSPKAKETIDRIIEATTPLRNYLKTHNNAGWQALLLTSGKSMGVPAPIRNISYITTDPRQQKKIAEQMVSIGIDPLRANSLVKRFSLTALRASIGVNIFIETGSVKAMADALGHADYSPDLLDYYLPASILKFYQDRWIRIFQTGMLVESMKDSELLLQVSGFSSMSELDEFLRHHAFKRLDDLEPAALSGSSTEVAFGISTGVLAVLIALQKAVSNATRTVNGRALYWAGIAERLVEYLQSDAGGREDLRQLIPQARASSVNCKFEKFIYA
jgi:hypothetical protein